MDLRASMPSFLDELEKISAAHGRSNVPKTREGRRPISVKTLLEKDKAGTLFKKADAQGNPQNVAVGFDDAGAAKPKPKPGDVPTRDDKLAMLQGSNTQTAPIPTFEEPYLHAEAKKPRKKGDVPSKEDSNIVDRYDGREFATTVHGQGQHSTDIGVTNHPSEHT